MAEVDSYNDEFNEYNEKILSEDDYSATSFESFDSDKATPQYHVQKAEMALHNLKFVVREPGWKKVLQHKSGATVYSKPGITRDDRLPVFMGQHIIDGFTPRAIFAVIGMRKLWDDWYEEGSLIENLNETTSLTYMVMQALAGSKPRDLSLVEKIECAQNGTIYFIATSVETPKVPRINNRIRAHLNLNGWILEPLSNNPLQTKVTYVLQTKIKGWVPSILSKTYLARRPLVLYTIDQYLQRNGALPMVVSTPPESIHPSRAQSDTSSTHLDNNNTLNIEVKYPRKKISFTNLNPDPPSQTTEEIQNGSLSHQDDPISSSSPSTQTAPSTQATSPMRPLSPTILTEKFNTLSQPKSFANPVQHRHTESIERALELFRSHIPLDGWRFHSENKGIKIYMKDSGKSTPIMRGDGVISGGFTTYDILSVIKNLKLWDDGFDEGTTYEMFSLHEYLTRTSMKGIFPISGRDFSVCGTLNHEEVGTLQFVSTSVVDPSIPESRKHVRGGLNFVGWQLKPHFDVDGKTTSVDVVYIADIDIKLDIVPSSIRKLLSVQIPTNVAKVNEYMQKNGFPPYILNSTTKILEDFSDKNGQYELSVIAEEDGVTEINLSKLMFPNGVEVSTIPEDCKVELLSDSTETIRVTFPQRIDLDTLTITISEHSKDFQMTYNHGRTIPTVGNPFKITKKSISMQPKHLSTNAALVVNEIINSESDNLTGSDKTDQRHARKHGKSARGSRSVITSKTFVNPAEVPLKSEPYQRLLEKKILLENKIAAVTRASRIDLAPIEVEPEQKPQVSNTILLENKIAAVTRESRIDLAPIEVEPEQKPQVSNTILLENKIAAVTRASRVDLAPIEAEPEIEEQEPQASNDDLVPLEAEPVTEESQTSNDDLTPLEVKPKTDETSNDDLAPLEVNPKTDELQASGDVMSPLENKPMKKVIKNNAIALSSFTDAVVFKDPIHFNSQQVGLMFASMILAYYAGKLSIL